MGNPKYKDRWEITMTTIAMMKINKQSKTKTGKRKIEERKAHLTIGTLNVRETYTKGAMKQILGEIKKAKFDIVAIQ